MVAKHRGERGWGRLQGVARAGERRLGLCRGAGSALLVHHLPSSSSPRPPPPFSHCCLPHPGLGGSGRAPGASLAPLKGTQAWLSPRTTSRGCGGPPATTAAEPRALSPPPAPPVPRPPASARRCRHGWLRRFLGIGSCPSSSAGCRKEAATSGSHPASPARCGCFPAPGGSRRAAGAAVVAGLCPHGKG